MGVSQQLLTPFSSPACPVPSGHVLADLSDPAEQRGSRGVPAEPLALCHIGLRKCVPGHPRKEHLKVWTSKYPNPELRLLPSPHAQAGFCCVHLPFLNGEVNFDCPVCQLSVPLL